MSDFPALFKAFFSRSPPYKDDGRLINMIYDETGVIKGEAVE